MTGRGAWSSVGKDNKQAQYAYVVGLPTDGGSKTKGLAYMAVNLGVKAIQTEINVQRLAASQLTADGIYGAKTAQAVREAQQNLDLYMDGKAGATTCKTLWRAPIKDIATSVGIDPKYLWGQMSHESTGDPAACGYYNEPDRGLTQINTAAHPDVSIEAAHDARFNLEFAANRFKEALAKYKSKPNVQIQCAVAQHNSPAAADTWFKNGTPPSDNIALYVEAVLGYTSGW